MAGGIAAAQDRPAGPVPSPPRLTGTKWADIDFGPSKTFSLQVSENNIAYKGIAVRLDEGLGGISSGNEFMIFDTDTLRWAGGLNKSRFLDWRGIALNGQHEIHPSIVGDLLFSNPVLPGWGRPSDGSFTDERVLGRDGLRYGPLAREWGHWKGHYIHGGKVVLSYSVGGTEILEMAGAEGPSSVRVMTRTLNLGPRARALTLQVAREEGVNIVLEEVGGLKIARFAIPKQDGATRSRSPVAFRGRTSLEIDGFNDNMQGDYSIYARIKTDNGGTIFSFVPESGPWAENSRALFVRNGNLVFDVGWVGEVQSRRRMVDGEWHDVAMTYDQASGDVRLYIDGRLNGKKRLMPADEVDNHIVRIGFASPDFPERPYFQGAISEVRFYAKRLDSDTVARLGESQVRQGLAGRWVMAEQRGEVVPNNAGRGHDARIVGGRDIPATEIVAAVRDGGAGSEFVGVLGENGVSDLRLTIPPGGYPVRLTLFIGRAPQGAELDAFAEVVRSSESATDLAPLTRGGPAHWTEKLVTRGELGNDDGAYAIDTITHPVDNPYRSWMRFGGFDFFEDDSRAAICTWSGDVWIVEGINESLEELTWQRIAAGMFQPLGIAIVDGDIYVACRDQITILRDLNGDGETDFYENFNNDHQVTEHFHEFALDLKFATDGNFYYTKGGRHGADSITPNHGTLIRVSRDGTKSEIVANGFRSPNGLGLGPAGEILISDNQGHWTPANRINWVRPGGFYGYMWGYHEGQSINGYDEPLCWIHNEVDRSPGTFAWVPDYRWGPLRGHIISASYGMGQIFHVLHEEIDGVRQGGVVKFPLEFDTGVTRAKFRKRDGQLYIAGLFGWSSNKTRPGAFYRVRYTGKNVYMPEELHIASDGVTLTFTDPLDPDSATDPGNYGISHWNYKWRQEYGSPDYKMDGTEGRDALQATWAALSTDRRTVYLEIPGIRKVMQMQILININAADGAEVRHRIQHTVHKLGHRSVRDLSGQTVVSGIRKPVEAPEDVTPGLVQTIVSTSTGASDARASRLAALYVAEGDPPCPFVPAGPFTSTWTGYIEVDLNERYRFSVEGNGHSELTVNGEPALDGIEIDLLQGLNRIELVYDSPPRGSAEFRLYWESRGLAREPVPPTAFARPEANSELDDGASNRIARALVAQYRCLRCHAPEAAASERGMPELRADAPALDRVGEKYNETWLIQRILDPKSQRPDSVMPRVFHGPDEKKNREDAAHIARYLMTLSRPANETSPPLNGGVQLVPTVLRGNAYSSELRDKGESLYNNLGCFTCHRLPEEDTFDVDPSRISLEAIQTKWRAGSLVEYLLNPHRDYAHNPMPNFRLSQDEAQALTSYLMASAKKGLTQAQRGTSADVSVPFLARARANTPAAVQPESGSADAGRELIQSRGCLNCHSIAEHSTALTAAPLSALRAGTLEAGCLAESDEPEAGAPEFDLTGQDRSALRSFIANKSDSLFRFDPSEYAERQLEALNCLACHARDGKGDRWTLLAPEDPRTHGGDPSKDNFWDDAETIHLQRPPLDFAGEKLRTAWMTDFLAGRLDYKPRPGLTARMPAFPAFADDIARGLAAQHGFPPIGADRSPIDTVLAAAGRELALSEDMFRCNSCHSVGAEGPLAGADTETINFAHIPDRLRRGYFDRFTLTPQRILPGTQMPQFADDDGRSSIPHVLDGDIGRQFDALWHFMRSLNNPDASVLGSKKKL